MQILCKTSRGLIKYGKQIGKNGPVSWRETSLIKAVKKHSRQPSKKKQSHALNQATLETQDKSGNLSLIMGTDGYDQGNHDVDELVPVIRPPDEQCEGVIGRHLQLLTRSISICL
ncbi:hypothetical protein O181_010225 [Austropuccinia psidii MF-1]|uniref:Uncharacterized protein n=1 Tax=Austropuccinia psidii MF-1 TaxID=1389203 RepID=A0A9Q3BSS5_9BASI|nr:hypothetical protein [Austropuccinia psidii MF-1]